MGAALILKGILIRRIDDPFNNDDDDDDFIAVYPRVALHLLYNKIQYLHLVYSYLQLYSNYLLTTQ